MKIIFHSEKIKFVKVGDVIHIPPGDGIVGVDWDEGDILPDRDAFEKYMKEVVSPKLLGGPRQMTYSMRLKFKAS